MPNVWTHFLFGEELVKAAFPESLPVDPYLRNLFRFGCQGPDFLFYHRFLPWQKAKGLPELGGAMHKRNCGPMLLDMIRSVQGKQVSDPSVIYVLGFMTHHVLDRNMHPYVFYRSGFRKWDHQRFEVMLDTLVVRQKLGLETWKTPVWKEIDAGERLPGDIVDMFMKLTVRHYPEWSSRIQAEDWQTAYRDMIRAQRLFHDPYGIKRVLTFGQISPLVYKRVLPPIDVLNEARREWRHPSAQEEAFALSVWDMWELAMEDGRRIMAAAADVLAADGGSNAPASALTEAWERLEEAVGDRSYETGKPCASGLEIVYADPIL